MAGSGAKKTTKSDSRQSSRNITMTEKGELYHHLFVRPDGRQVLLVWDKKGSPTVSIRTRKGVQAVEFSLNGTAMPFPGFDGRTLNSVRLSPGMVRIFEIR